MTIVPTENWPQVEAAAHTQLSPEIVEAIARLLAEQLHSIAKK